MPQNDEIMILFHCSIVLFCIFINYYRIKVFPKEEVLWRELRKVVQSQEVNASELDVETKFLRGNCKK